MATRSRLAQAGQDQAAMVALHGQELRERRLEAQVGGVRGIDARDQGLDQPIQGLAAQATPHEPRQALLHLIIPTRDEQVHQHAELATPGQDRRREHWTQPSRRHQHEALGDRHQPALPDHERPPVARIRLDQPVAQAQPLAQIEAPWLVRDKGIRAALECETIEPFRRDHAPQPVLGFQYLQIDRPAQRPRSLVNPVRSRQAGEAPADHDHSIRFRSGRTYARPRLLAPS